MFKSFDSSIEALNFIEAEFGLIEPDYEAVNDAFNYLRKVLNG